MAGKLKEAIERNRRAAEELDAALRDCLRELRNPADNVVEGRFRIVVGHRERVAGGHER